MHPGINRALINHGLEKLRKMEEPREYAQGVVDTYESLQREHWIMSFLWWKPSEKYDAARTYLKEFERAN